MRIALIARIALALSLVVSPLWAQLMPSSPDARVPADGQASRMDEQSSQSLTPDDLEAWLDGYVPFALAR